MADKKIKEETDLNNITKSDSEVNGAVSNDFDPFKARQLDNPVSDSDTFTHLLKSSVGTGILAMPDGFRNSGLVIGVVGTIVVSVICIHCAYILVLCAHDLYKRTGKTSTTFAEVAEESCLRGPRWSRKCAPYARHIVQLGIFAVYFSVCSCYAVIISRNFEQVANYYVGYELDSRMCIAALLVPLILLSWIPNLKFLVPVSMLANVLMAVGLGITYYYLMVDLPPISERTLVAPVTTWPILVSVTIFAIDTIGIVMPLENHMKQPQHFVGPFGILNRGVAGITLIYIFMGFFGYWKYGDATMGSITLNLDQSEYLAQFIKILIAVAVLCTFALQFYVCFEIAWTGIKDRFINRPTLANYFLRTAMVIIAVAIAIAVPTITPFIGLIGALLLSILGLMVPVFIEVVIFWDQGFGKYNWKILKNVIIIIAGLIAMIFGSKSAIEDIVKMYTN